MQSTNNSNKHKATQLTTPAAAPPAEAAATVQSSLSISKSCNETTNTSEPNSVRIYMEYVNEAMADSDPLHYLPVYYGMTLHYAA